MTSVGRKMTADTGDMIQSPHCFQGVKAQYISIIHLIFNVIYVIIQILREQSHLMKPLARQKHVMAATSHTLLTLM